MNLSVINDDVWISLYINTKYTPTHFIIVQILKSETFAWISRKCRYFYSIE